jgi:hypothetical protein
MADRVFAAALANEPLATDSSTAGHAIPHNVFFRACFDRLPNELRNGQVFAADFTEFLSASTSVALPRSFGHIVDATESIAENAIFLDAMAHQKVAYVSRYFQILRDFLGDTRPLGEGEISGALEQEMTALLEAAEYQELEVGVSSDFSRNLARLISAYGVAAVQMLAACIETHRPSPAVMSVLLRQLGAMRDSLTRGYRRELLSRLLRSKSLQVRHAAGAALASLRDPLAIPALEQAIEREAFERPRLYLQSVLERLRDTRGVSVSSR